VRESVHLGSFEIFMQTIVKLFTIIDYKNNMVIIHQGREDIFLRRGR
jgi:hypothetical protein